MTAQDGLDVLVIGATGNQGGALARHLIERGHRVRGLTRDPEKPAAKALAEKGAKMMQGYLLNAESLQQAAAGVDVAFLMTTPYGAGGPEGETKQGITAVDALGQAGVPHLVYASVANADRETGIPQYDSKRVVEEHILNVGMPFTVVAPVFFRENLFAPWCLRPDSLQIPLPMERRLQNISVDEVGAFHAYVVENHQDLMGERIDIASDANTPVEMAKAIADASDTDFRFQRVQYVDVKELSGDLARMYEWYDRVGFRVDIERLKSDYPDLPWRSFREWAAEQDWAAKGVTGEVPEEDEDGPVEEAVEEVEEQA